MFPSKIETLDDCTPHMKTLSGKQYENPRCGDSSSVEMHPLEDFGEDLERNKG